MNDLKTVRDALELCRFALEPYNDIKPRDWSTDRQNLRFAHEDAVKALATLDRMIETPAPQGWKLVPIADIKALDVLADAYEDANECDYCSDAYPEHEGCRPDELANKFVRQAKLLSAAPTPAPTEKVERIEGLE